MENLTDSQKDKSITDISKQAKGDMSLRNTLKKAEKIAAALFIVTGSIEKDDIIKYRARELVIDILSFMNNLDLDSQLSPLVARQMLPVKCYTEEITSLLNVSRMSGLISEMNYQILIKELNTFCQNLDSAQLLPSLLEAGQENKNDNEQLTTLNNTKDFTNSIRVNPRFNPRQSASKRKDIILNFLKDKKQVCTERGGRFEGATIKDICKIKDKSIINCSEKTIQRELMSLIKSGLIKRTGDKRWTKYSLQ